MSYFPPALVTNFYSSSQHLFAQQTFLPLSYFCSGYFITVTETRTGLTFLGLRAPFLKVCVLQGMSQVFPESVQQHRVLLYLLHRHNHHHCMEAATDTCKPSVVVRQTLLRTKILDPLLISPHHKISTSCIIFKY